MGLYQEDGYLNWERVLAYKLPFNFMTGGRGIGKTYGILKIAKEENINFIFLRRTQTQIDIISNPKYSPFKQLNTDMHWNIDVRSTTKNTYEFYDVNDESERTIGTACALSTFSNLRGFDASEVNIIIFDEFIPEKQERPIKNEATAFLNAYETICRNREIKGLPPVYVYALANANDMANPLFMELKIVRKATKMKQKKQEISIDRERGLGLFNIEHSPISEKKKQGALYKLTGDSDFTSMALDNQFVYEDIGRIKSKPLIEYKPIVSIGEICIYQHKSNNSIYVSTHIMDCPVTFGMGDMERLRFRRMYSWLWEEYIENNIEFEEYLCEILLTKYYS